MYPLSVHMLSCPIFKLSDHLTSIGVAASSVLMASTLFACGDYPQATTNPALSMISELDDCPSPEQPEQWSGYTSYSIIPDGHGVGRDMAVIQWKTQDNILAGEVEIPITGKGRIGPVTVDMTALGSIPNAYEWDTREWQWWKGYPFEPGEMRPRQTVATGGIDTGNGGVRVWSRWVTDDIETVQEWFFDDLSNADEIIYDCVITIRNLGADVIEQYGQFFASYTAWNNESGHFYVDAAGSVRNFTDAGSGHLDYYITAVDSPFDVLGNIPHCSKVDCPIKDNWRYPMSISHANGTDNYRHLVMSEEAYTSGMAQGENGNAQDYIIYPPSMKIEPNESFSLHVRHLLTMIPANANLLDELDIRWNQFEADHSDVRALARESVGLVQFTVAELTVPEEAGTVEITVTRSAGATGAAGVDILFSDGTALRGQDFDVTQCRLNWGDGESGERTISLMLVDDEEQEEPETLTVTLSDATGALVAEPRDLQITIMDNDSGGMDSPSDSGGPGLVTGGCSCGGFGSPWLLCLLVLPMWRQRKRML